LSIRQRGECRFSDERISGSGDFVEEVLGFVGELQKEMVPMRLRQVDAHEMLERECSEKGLSVETLRSGSRNREYSPIRRELAGKFLIDLGLSHAEAVRMPGISRAGVSMLMRG
jgi:hypothetical protein